MDEDKLHELDFSKLTEMAGKLGQWTLDTNAMNKKFNQNMDIAYRAFNPNQEAIQNMHEKKERYDQDVLNTLKQIEGNTANLITLVNLIQTSNDKQDEVLEIITDLFALAKEIEEEEVKTNYRKVMDKINSFNGDIETMMTLSTFGMMIYQAVTVGA